MARHVRVGPPGGGGGEDCVHFCQPGPVDTWMQLVFNLWATSSALQGRTASALPMEGNRAERVERRAFFESSRDDWLSARGSARARALEECAGPRRACYNCLADRWWWPYGNCSCDTHSCSGASE
eukprot:5670860-Prymnesium_polylepis.1